MVLDGRGEAVPPASTAEEATNGGVEQRPHDGDAPVAAGREEQALQAQLRLPRFRSVKLVGDRLDMQRIVSQSLALFAVCKRVHACEERVSLPVWAPPEAPFCWHGNRVRYPVTAPANQCKCRSFFFIVAEGSWILRCSCKVKRCSPLSSRLLKGAPVPTLQHKHDEHDSFAIAIMLGHHINNTLYRMQNQGKFSNSFRSLLT
eukprot:SM000070S21322  [mRNA]  locus=s70:223106:224453:+ [translate_table: standard]